MRSLRARPLVLIVEDDPDVLLILRLNLEGAGCDTTLAADGRSKTTSNTIASVKASSTPVSRP